ncbi:hypothetical protein BDZ89DRAFT_1132912 [Hymenopellis radicata]|nr:hypothetical protein BDZ89DRAFT_1132912 [Hymenopellis radicata]
MALHQAYTNIRAIRSRITLFLLAVLAIGSFLWRLLFSLLYPIWSWFRRRTSILDPAWLYIKTRLSSYWPWSSRAELGVDYLQALYMRDKAYGRIIAVRKSTKAAIAQSIEDPPRDSTDSAAGQIAQLTQTASASYEDGPASPTTSTTARSLLYTASTSGVKREATPSTTVSSLPALPQATEQTSSVFSLTKDLLPPSTPIRHTDAAPTILSPPSSTVAAEMRGSGIIVQPVSSSVSSSMRHRSTAVSFDQALSTDQATTDQATTDQALSTDKALSDVETDSETSTQPTSLSLFTS